MAYQFSRHHTLAEARALLPRLREWLVQLQVLQKRLDSFERRLAGRLEGGADAGGGMVNDWARTMADFAGVFQEFRSREIQIKDLNRGLLDIPSLRNDVEVFLCWELGEEEIEFWHEIHAGYAGRERL
ncbi:MAG: DUF2203 domain-containing protein [Verrucomicrobiota bacterium]